MIFKYDVPGKRISPNPNKEYGLSQTDIAVFIILGTLITMGSCSFDPLPEKQTSITYKNAMSIP